jgi:ATP-dependent exoDNAse (exonuclease V) beta subunit
LQIVEGATPGSITILGRTKSELLKCQEALLKNGFKSILNVPEVVKENPYVQSMFALNSYLSNNEDIKSLAYYAKSIGKDPLNLKEVLKVGKDLKDNIINLKTEGERLNAYFEYLEDISENDYLAKDFFNKLKNKGFATLNEAISYLVKYDRYGVSDTYSSDTQEPDAINLITIHSSKGLEYNNVILLTEKFRNTSEEKRLFYVAITRARKNLAIIANDNQRQLIDLIK